MNMNISQPQPSEDTTSILEISDFMLEQNSAASVSLVGEAQLSKSARTRAAKQSRTSESAPRHILEWFAHFHSWDYITAPTTPTQLGKPAWKTATDRQLYPASLYKHWQDPRILIGVRFKAGRQGKTRYTMLDVDIGSPYHPDASPEQVKNLLASLENIGLCRSLLVQSSHSRGLHIYVPLPESVSCHWIAYVVKLTVEEAGFVVQNGQLEIFPNIKAPKSLFQAHRLPLQVGSFVLDQDFQPLHDSLDTLIRDWHGAASYQDFELLRESIESIQNDFQSYSGYSKSKLTGDVLEWLQRLEETLEIGWTGEGQTNQIVRDVCQYATVFLEEDVNTEQWVIDTVKQLPGFQQFCNHQHDIEQRVRDWLKTNRGSGRYYPYTGSKKVSRGNSNEKRRMNARERIESAIADIIAKYGSLPDGVGKRCKLICKIAQCSSSTLYKHKELWHPDLVGQEGVTEV